MGNYLFFALRPQQFWTIIFISHCPAECLGPLFIFRMSVWHKAFIFWTIIFFRASGLRLVSWPWASGQPADLRSAILDHYFFFAAHSWILGPLFLFRSTQLDFLDHYFYFAVLSWDLWPIFFRTDTSIYRKFLDHYFYFACEIKIMVLRKINFMVL